LRFASLVLLFASVGAASLKLPPTASFDLVTVGAKAHFSVEQGKLLLFQSANITVAYFPSNKTQYTLLNADTCFASTPKQQDVDSLDILAMLNKNSKPDNKACASGTNKGQLYTVTIPTAVRETKLCASTDGTVPYYVLSRNSTQTEKSEFQKFSTKPDSSFRLSSKCAVSSKKLKIPAQYSYKFNSKSYNANYSLTTSGNVTDNGVASIKIEKANYAENTILFFRSNSTTYYYYPGGRGSCSAYNSSTNTTVNYSDRINIVRANQDNSFYIRSTDQKCQQDGQEGTIWIDAGNGQLCANAAGDTPIYYESKLGDTTTRINYSDFRPQVDPNATIQLPNACLTVRPRL